MNGEVCCILGICCPPDSPERIAALAREIGKDFGCSDLEAKAYAAWMIGHFALAPKTLEPFITDIVRHARHSKR